MRKLLLLALLLTVGCSSSGSKFKFPAQPTEQPDNLLKAQSFFDVVEGRVWLEEGDLPMLSGVRREVLRILKANQHGTNNLSRFLPELLGTDKTFTFIPTDLGKDGKAIKVKATSAKFVFIKDGDQAGHEAEFGQCHSFPWQVLKIALDPVGGRKQKMNGYLFPGGASFIPRPENEIQELFKIYRTTHLEFIKKTYGDAFPDYGNVIDTSTTAVRTRDSMIYFLAPNPSVDYNNYRAYRIDERVKTIWPITLRTRLSCEN